ncbi:uncharacterized protein BT62DRAFT_1013664 [Guyanagaster necrorhizus]|uniref:Uncharacterized protein n=1 Tax=Guyanagaster necrorhizus TaxID=856835 RepID=A0A9P8ALB9_9AGAR|nr:uncharacterized protein BT62DRAFT_1013664 [Guyanagaster necrorhizus MCA 3950]KAG7439625.1 hypothetical protein BT62DRAFT_1013664 [Guyanagaster necrorhizus MCA 3950]
MTSILNPSRSTSVDRASYVVRETAKKSIRYVIGTNENADDQAPLHYDYKVKTRARLKTRNQEKGIRLADASTNYVDNQFLNTIGSDTTVLVADLDSHSDSHYGIFAWNLTHFTIANISKETGRLDCKPPLAVEVSDPSIWVPFPSYSIVAVFIVKNSGPVAKGDHASQ